MKKNEFSETQILNILNEQEQGMAFAIICRNHGMISPESVAQFHRNISF